VIAWAKVASLKPGFAPLALLFAIPNFAGHTGGKVARLIAGAKAKREGRKSGVPDLFLPHARCLIPHVNITGRWEFGLFIEMKRLAGGSASATQRSWHVRLRDAGYRVEVCRGAEAAKDVLTDYITP